MHLLDCVQVFEGMSYRTNDNGMDSFHSKKIKMFPELMTIVY